MNATIQSVRAQPNLALVSVIALTLMGVVSYLPLLTVFASGMMEEGIPLIISNRDFANYWVAAKLSHQGAHLDLFSQPIYFAHLRDIFGADYPIHNWGYPPHTLLLLWPLGFLGYKAGMVAFLVTSLVLFLTSALVFRQTYAPDSAKVLFILPVVGFVAMMIDTAQNGFLTGAALLFGLSWMRSRPLLAGIAFAVLTIKPQLGFLIPLLLLLNRNYSTFLWAGMFSAVLFVGSTLFFGMDAWLAYIQETLPYQRSVMSDWFGIFLRMMPTTFGSMRTLGFSPDTAWMGQLPVSILGTGSVLWILYKEHDPLRQAFILCCGTLLISPYAFNYDMGALAVSAGVLLGSRKLPPATSAALGVAAALAPAVMNLGRAGLPISPIVLAAALIAVGSNQFRTRSA